MDFGQYCVPFVAFVLVILHLGPSYGVLAVVIRCFRRVAVQMPTIENRVRFVRYGGSVNPVWLGWKLVVPVFDVPADLAVAAITQRGVWRAGPLRERGEAPAIIRLENWIEIDRPRSSAGVPPAGPG